MRSSVSTPDLPRPHRAFRIRTVIELDPRLVARPRLAPWMRHGLHYVVQSSVGARGRTFWHTTIGLILCYTPEMGCVNLTPAPQEVEDHTMGMDAVAAVAGNPGAGFASGLGAGGGGWEREKAAVEVHPLYERLLEAHVACLRVATPVDQLPRIDTQIAARAPPPLPPADAPSGDEELDLFMT